MHLRLVLPDGSTQSLTATDGHAAQVVVDQAGDDFAGGVGEAVGGGCGVGVEVDAAFKADGVSGGVASAAGVVVAPVVVVQAAFAVEVLAGVAKVVGQCQCGVGAGFTLGGAKGCCFRCIGQETLLIEMRPT